MKIKLALLIALVLVFSGCVGIPDVFGRDVISVQQRVIENGVRDVIVVKDVETIPKSPLLPDQQIILSFIIENRDTLKSSRSYVDLFNAPTMRDLNDRPCNFYSVSGYLPTPQPSSPSSERFCAPDQCGIGGCDILPGEEKPINIIMKTPTENDIKNIRTETKLNFKTTYEFDGSLNFLVPAVDTQEIIKRQRSGDKTELFTTKSHGSGPVQIDAELQGAPYILSNLEAVLYFKIKNRGSGTLVKSQVDNGKMEILFPLEFEVVRGQHSEKFDCQLTAGGTLCTNNVVKNNQDLGTIPLYRDESRSSLRFTVRLKAPLLEPFRSYPITATVKYNYELRNDIGITVNPFQNV